MKISEIRNFLERIEKTLLKLQIDFDERDDFYYCSNLGKHCILIPYISSMEFSFPDYKNCFNYIIISNGDFLGNDADVKFLTISDFEAIADKSIANSFVKELVCSYLFNRDLVKTVENISKERLLDSTNVKEKKKATPAKIESKKQSEEGYKINISSIENQIGQSLKKIGRGYIGVNTYVFVACSKYHDTNKYWYSYHNESRDLMDENGDGFVCLFFKDRPQYLLMPKLFFNSYLYKLGSSKNGNKEWWHINIRFIKDNCFMLIPKQEKVDVTKFLIIDENIINNVKEPIITDEEKKLDSSVVIKITSTNFHTAKVKK